MPSVGSGYRKGEWQLIAIYKPQQEMLVQDHQSNGRSRVFCLQGKTKVLIYCDINTYLNSGSIGNNWAEFAQIERGERIER